MEEGPNLEHGTPLGGLPRSSPRGQRLWLVSFSLYPRADIGWAVHERDPFRFAPGEKPHSLAIYQPYLVQIQHEANPIAFQSEESLQLCHLFPLDAPTEDKDDALPVCRSLDLQHQYCFRDTISVPVAVQCPDQA